MRESEEQEETMRKLRELGVSLSALQVRTEGSGYPCGADRCNGCGKCTREPAKGK